MIPLTLFAYLFQICLSICLKILSCSLGGCVVSTDILLTGVGLVCCVASKIPHQASPLCFLHGLKFGILTLNFYKI
jgi:hypothetical protein